MISRDEKFTLNYPAPYFQRTENISFFRELVFVTEIFSASIYKSSLGMANIFMNGFL